MASAERDLRLMARGGVAFAFGEREFVGVEVAGSMRFRYS
jgi:hypothetical protein